MIFKKLYHWVMNLPIARLQFFPMRKTCPFCKQGKLFRMEEYQPFNDSYLICDKCDSTFCI